jgi:hypothetical protein
MIYAILDSQYKLDGFNPSEVISLTLSEAKFNDIVQRGGSLSNQVKIAKTSNNQKTLGLLDDANADTPQAYKLFNADLYVDALKVFSGNAQILESNEFYTIRFFSSSAGFFSQLKGRNLNTINLSSLNHTWTATNVNTRRQATTGVVYPNINYGRWTDVAFNAKAHTDWFPAVYIQTLFDTIATELGYVYTPIPNLTRVLPFSKKDFTNNESLVSEVSTSGDQSLTLTIDPETAYTEFVTETSNALDLFSQDTGGAKDYTSLIVFGKGNLELELFLSYETGASALNSVLEVVDLTANNVLAQISVAPSTIGNQTLNLSISNPLTSTLKTIVVRTTVQSITIKSGSSFKVISGELTIQSTGIIAIQDTLPDIGITDLFKYIAVKQNALIVVDNVAKTIDFVRFNDIASRFYKAIDLTDKISNVNDIKKYYRKSEYAQINFIDYKVPDLETDPTATPTSRGRGTFTIADTNLERNKVLYESEFYRTGIFEGLKTKDLMLLIPRYSLTSLAYDAPDIDPKVRAVDCVINTSLEIQVTGQALPSPQANATFEGFSKDITDNYQAFIAAFDKCKIIEVPITINNDDLAALSFDTPISLLDAYWYIMEIKEYEVNRPSPTIFKLLRIF